MPEIKNLNPDDKATIEEFKVRMQNILPSNYYQDKSVFYRFLKARDFDMDKAEKMLRKNITWRKAFQMDTILENFKPREAYLKYIEPNVVGLDKDGDLIVYVAIGKMESRDVFKYIKMSELMRHIMWFGEKCFPYLTRQIEQKENHVLQMALIFDLDELSFANTTSKASIDEMLRITHLAQDNFPERLKSIKIINAPSYYVLIFTILKAVMSSLMIRKFSIFARSGWKEHFLETMSADVLPAFLGGNRTDPDGNPRCNTFLVHGGKADEKYTLSNEDRYFTDIKRVKLVIVPPMEKREIFVEVTENGSLIEWEFLVRGKDIRFGLSLRKNEHVVEILPEEKYTTPDGTEKGSYKCQAIGEYIVLFDNSDSWWSSKAIEYCLAVKNDQCTRI